MDSFIIRSGGSVCSKVGGGSLWEILEGSPPAGAGPGFGLASGGLRLHGGSLLLYPLLLYPLALVWMLGRS